MVKVENLKVYYGPRRDPVRAVDGVSFTVEEGESVGLVGESGSGKSSLGRAILKLEPIHEGRVLFDGIDVTTLRGAALKQFRQRAQMIFQDPYGSLNPRIAVGPAIQEVLSVHRLEQPGRVEELLKAVGLDPEYRRRFPHEFSGGQRQRIGIARSLAVKPELIVADEPVSALDVSVQVQILNLLKDLQEEFSLSYLFIAHDLSVVRYVCDRVLVMQHGKIVESGRVEEIFKNPRHPYTASLLAAVPDVKRGLEQRKNLEGPAVPRPG